MLKTEFEKIKKMSPSEAGDYLWTYYKLYFLAGAFVLIMAISLISAVSENKRTDPVLRVGIQNDIELLYGKELTELLEETYPEAAGYTEPVKLNFSSAASQNDPYALVQLATWLGAGEIDCLICDSATRDYLLQNPEEFDVADLSGTVPGKLSAENGVGDLFFVTVKGAEKAGNAEAFLQRLKAL